MPLTNVAGGAPGRTDASAARTTPRRRSEGRTSVGVESTARSAHEHGYHVVLATDVMFDSDPESHAHSVTRVFPRLGEATTTEQLLHELNRL